MGHGLNYDHAALSLVSSLLVASSLETFLIPALCGIYRASDTSLDYTIARDYNALQCEIDIVTNVTEPSTIFRD